MSESKQRLIARKRVRLESLIKKNTEELRALQESCTHPFKHAKYGSNTGNYLSKDIYWIDYHCGDCHKSWRERDDAA